MVAIIKSSASMRNVLHYNENKAKQNVAEVNSLNELRERHRKTEFHRQVGLTIQTIKFISQRVLFLGQETKLRNAKEQ